MIETKNAQTILKDIIIRTFNTFLFIDLALMRILNFTSIKITFLILTNC